MVGTKTKLVVSQRDFFHDSDLNNDILRGQRIDDLDSPGLLGQHPYAVLVVLPPGPAEVIGPVVCGVGRRYVDESAFGTIVLFAASHRVYVCLDLQTKTHKNTSWHVLKLQEVIIPTTETENYTRLYVPFFHANSATTIQHQTR